jgi:hypothetical protein
LIRVVIVFIGVNRMKPLTVLLLSFGAFVLLPVALYISDRVDSSRHKPVREPRTLTDVLHEIRRGEQLETDRGLLFPGISEREKLTNELIEGRISLRVAAMDLREHYERKPPYLRQRVACSPGQTLEEYFLRQVLLWVEVALRDDPRRDAVLARLRSELHKCLDSQSMAQP